MQVAQTHWPEPRSAEGIRAERRAKWFWVSGIVGLLGLQVAIGAVAIYLAHSDNTVAVIPNYYQSAVNWDTTRRARQLSEELGWQSQCVVGEAVGTLRPVRFTLTDAEKAPVGDARISAKLFHHAQGSEVYTIHFSESEPGIYEATSPLTKSGLWQVSLQIEGEHGIAAIEQQVLVR